MTDIAGNLQRIEDLDGHVIAQALARLSTLIGVSLTRFRARSCDEDAFFDLDRIQILTPVSTVSYPANEAVSDRTATAFPEA